MNPILETLKKTPHEYLFRLISQFNSGDMDGFNQTKLLSEFNKQPLLSAAIPFLSQKLCVMTLIEVVFKRSKEVRGQISFIDIARECRVGIDEVEHLVMKAFSLGVVKGEVDEIKSLVHISWVLPRVLDKKQISSLKGILMDWRERVQQQVVDLKNVEGASDLFVN